MATLYNLTTDYLQLLDLMGDPDADPQTVEDTMEGLEGEMSMKFDSYVTVIKSLEGDNDVDKREIERLQSRVDSRAKNILKMKTSMMDSLRALNMKKVSTEHYTISRQGNGGKRPLRVTGEVPEAFYKMTPSVDKDKIREALEAGEELGFACLDERGESLRIK